MGEIYVSQVKKLREARGLTQRQLADIVGVDPSTIRNWESGRSSVDLFVKFAKLCNALDSAPDDLFGVVDPAEEGEAASSEVD